MASAARRAPRSRAATASFTGVSRSPPIFRGYFRQHRETAFGRSFFLIRLGALHHREVQKVDSEKIDLDQYRLLSRCIGWCADIEEAPMRTLAALTILTMSMALADGQARAQTYAPGYPVCMRVTPWVGSTYYDRT